MPHEYILRLATLSADLFRFFLQIEMECWMSNFQFSAAAPYF
jgi:hypothetical protein